MDRGGFQQKTITFVIKTPNLAHGDQTVEGVDMDWTVVDLKRHLSAVYPSKPAVSDQRLIYSGKLLPDHLHLRDIFRQTDCAPTLHLVCSARAPARGPLGARPKVRETEQLHAASASTAQTSSSTSLDHSPSSSPVQSTPTPPPVQSTPTPPPVQSTPATPPVQSTPATPPVQSTPATPELRQRRHAAPAASTPQPHHTQTPAWPGTAVPGVAEMAQPAFPTYSLYSPQQLLWLQHVYARQYYMQYHAALAAAGHGTASLAPAATTFGPYPPVPAHHHPAPVPAALPNQNPIEPLAPANQNAGAQDGAFIDPAAAANQNLRMNAQGGPVMEDEEDVERDWLDWVYTVARLAVFLSIVYFYSTLSRFVLVMSSLLLMYLHTAGWFPFRRRPLVQGPNQQRPQAQQPPQAQQNPAPGEELADGERAGHDAAGEGPEGQGPMAAVLVPPYRVSVMWTAWVFFKSFFSSLIPEAQQGVAN